MIMAKVLWKTYLWQKYYDFCYCVSYGLTDITIIDQKLLRKNYPEFPWLLEPPVPVIHFPGDLKVMTRVYENCSNQSFKNVP